jgi:cyclophilin family peptidyl-prolyl cis-trans isomerase
VIPVVALLLAVAQATAPIEEKGDRVVVNTTAGGIVILLDPVAAPKAVDYFKSLVRAHVYDGTRVYRIEPNFVIQTSLAEDRDRALSIGQSALLHGLTLEKNDLRHERGAVSMATVTGDPTPVSSFAFVLQPSPHLDGRYTVFGRVESGFDVLDEIAGLPTNSNWHPLIPVSLEQLTLVETQDEAVLRRLPRRYLNAERLGVSRKGIRAEISLLAAVILFSTVALAFLGKALPPRTYAAARMTVVLVGAFGFVVVLAPLGPRAPLFGLALLVGVIALFKWMGRFELPPGAGRATPPKQT